MHFSIIISFKRKDSSSVVFFNKKNEFFDKKTFYISLFFFLVRTFLFIEIGFRRSDNQ